MQIVWMDEEGNPVKGEPRVVFQGVHIHADTVSLGAKGLVAG